ncbi:methyl-accepting chemotaxis protein [Chitinibacter sp. SCUT-21]|uniref:methyl-accepting chemotaxis protein n=1 Tax=Chitinibacter sp. SCUT-21 TaxID=2970891 RepID=UPI0035A58A33
MNFTVAQRLVTGFILLMLLLSVSDFLAIRGINTISEDMDEIVTANTEQMRNASIMIDRLQEIRVQYRQLILEPDPDQQAKTTEKYQAAKKDYLAAEAELSKLFASPDYPADEQEKKAVGLIKSEQEATFALVENKLLKLTAAGNFAEARSVINGDLAVKVTNLNQALRDFADYEHQSNQEKVQQTKTDISTTKSLMIMITVLALLVGCITAYFVTRSITIPLGAMQQFMQKLGSHFDFTERMPVKNNDEIGKSIVALNALLDSLQASLKRVHQVGRDVSTSVNTLMATSHEMSQTSTAVSESASAMAAGIEEVTVSIGHVADRAQESDHTARDAGRLAATGGTVIEDTISSINQIAEQVRASALQIESLKERTATINAVVNVIKDIADQTNLLALNAAIEAARAGDLGRGFAVVADEVRKLAERTSSSTQEIISTVASIQNEANTTVQTMQMTVRQVDEGVSRAQQASKAIGDIRHSADTVVDQVSEISTAMREQSSASSVMAQQVERVAQMSEESSAAAASTAAESSRLNDLGQQLDQAISRYRV